MSDAPPRRRRSIPTVSNDPLRSSIKAARSAPPDSPAALRAAQEAVFHVLMELQPAIGSILNPDASCRASWIRSLHFLTQTDRFPALRDLAIALQELDRGVVHAALIPALGGRRGGKHDTRFLEIRRDAVEAADELRRRCKCHEEYKARVRELGSSASTVESYRKSLLSGPAEFRPRSSYRLTWGEEKPEDLLCGATRRIGDLRDATDEDSTT